MILSAWTWKFGWAKFSLSLWGVLKCAGEESGENTRCCSNKNHKRSLCLTVWWISNSPEVPPVPQSVSHSNKIYIMCSIVMGLDSRASGVCCNAVNGCQEHNTIQSTQGTEWFTWTSSGFFVSLCNWVPCFLVSIHLLMIWGICSSPSFSCWR